MAACAGIWQGLAKPDVMAPGHKMVGPAAPGNTLGLLHPELLLPGNPGTGLYLGTAKNGVKYDEAYLL